MATSLNWNSSDMKLYLTGNKLPGIYEALLSAVMVMRPFDPIQFILDKLTYLLEHGLDDLQWDMFIDVHMRAKKMVTLSQLSFIFDCDEWLTLTPEMYATAYNHYNKKLKENYYCLWMQYILMQKREVEQMNSKIALASRYHSDLMLHIHMRTWKAWVRRRKGRQAVAFYRIEHLFHVYIGRLIFEAWSCHTLEARKQREYFEKLERGEEMEDGDQCQHGSGDAHDSVSNLPKKIAVQIFSHVSLIDLARCACVCRSWKVLTQSNLIWCRMNFYDVHERVSDRIVCRLLPKARMYLAHLNMRQCHHIQRASFVAISLCRNIQDLNLSDCFGLDDESLELIVKGCRILLYLNISHTAITDGALRAIGKHCLNLQYLCLAYCAKFSDRGLKYLAAAKSARNLEYLELSGCLQVTPLGFRNLASGCVGLNTVIVDDFPTLMDDSIVMLADKCAGIHTVSFLGCPLLTDEIFKRLAHHKHLQVLKVEGNQRISDMSIKAVSKMCPRMRHVYLADCQKITDTALKYLSFCKDLTVLNVADCVMISDLGVRRLAEGLCSGRLRELNLTNCVRVGDVGLLNLQKRCHQLTHLKLNYCSQVSEGGIETLGTIRSLVSVDISGSSCGDQAVSALGSNTNLRDVCLSECPNVTDLGLQKFTQQCQLIHSFDISHCLPVTDSAIKNLAFCCRLLTVLNMAGCRLVTDLSIQYLSGVCHHLTTLDISGCLLISDKGLKCLRKSCRKLNSLSMLYCKGITKHAVLKLGRRVRVVKYSCDDVPSYYGYY